MQSNTLEYSREVFQKIYHQQLLADFNHGPLTKGPVNPKKVQETIARLNSLKGSTAIQFISSAAEQELVWRGLHCNRHPHRQSSLRHTLRR
ncbi:MAG: hypothetical protein LLG04_11440 [Parachlamydia sp.]|nr:hypothetical protein [Parachlamydia sp.]